MEDKPDFAFVKKLGIVDIPDQTVSIVLEVFHKLFVCMKETNDFHKVSCEFFRLDFRPQSLEEELLRKFSVGSLVMELKWGSKKELEKSKD
jgi:hypothetical protein